MSVKFDAKKRRATVVNLSSTHSLINTHPKPQTPTLTLAPAPTQTQPNHSNLTLNGTGYEGFGCKQSFKIGQEDQRE
eukprot:1343808-Amorphochlora_amoeboformis.AAC.1